VFIWARKKFSATNPAALRRHHSWKEQSMNRTRIDCPFGGKFDRSKEAILGVLGIDEIANHGVLEVRIKFLNAPDEDYVITPGEGKHYGVAFFAYLAHRYATGMKKTYMIADKMIFEAILYYGWGLWDDKTKEHPAITPFRRATKGDRIRVSLTYRYARD
jgi:hypothetical protein